eukprot:353069-Chlamydomonas_euryale.AAC.33
MDDKQATCTPTLCPSNCWHAQADDCSEMPDKSVREVQDIRCELDWLALPHDLGHAPCTSSSSHPLGTIQVELASPDVGRRQRRQPPQCLALGIDDVPLLGRVCRIRRGRVVRLVHDVLLGRRQLGDGCARKTRAAERSKAVRNTAFELSSQRKSQYPLRRHWRRSRSS